VTDDEVDAWRANLMNKVQSGEIVPSPGWNSEVLPQFAMAENLPARPYPPNPQGPSRAMTCPMGLCRLEITMTSNISRHGRIAHPPNLRALGPARRRAPAGGGRRPNWLSVSANQPSL
jgi:hypothetical protein